MHVYVFSYKITNRIMHQGLYKQKIERMLADIRKRAKRNASSVYYKVCSGDTVFL